MFLCSGGKIYVYKVAPYVSLSNHTWLSLIEFAVEITECVEVRAMAMRLGFSLVAWEFVGSFLKSQAEVERPLLDPSANVSLILM